MPWKDLLRFSFCFLSFNSSIARPFDSSGVGGFLGISPLFASFPSRPERPLSIFVFGYSHTSEITQLNVTLTQLTHINIIHSTFNIGHPTQHACNFTSTFFFWSLKRNIFGQYSKIFLVNTAKHVWSIQLNVFGQYSTFPRLSMDFGQSIFPLRIFS